MNRVPLIALAVAPDAPIRRVSPLAMVALAWFSLLTTLNPLAEVMVGMFAITLVELALLEIRMEWFAAPTRELNQALAILHPNGKFLTLVHAEEGPDSLLMSMRIMPP